MLRQTTSKTKVKSKPQLKINSQHKSLKQHNKTKRLHKIPKGSFSSSNATTISVPGQKPFQSQLTPDQRQLLVQAMHDVPVDKKTFHPQPMNQFLSWFKDVSSIEPIMPERMTVSTIKKLSNGSLVPSSRPVLLKEIILGDTMVSPYSIIPPIRNLPDLQTTSFFPLTHDPNNCITGTNIPYPIDITTELLQTGGFSFVTNYNSNKGKQIEENPYCSLTFHWVELERVVRIEGKITKVPESLSMLYHLQRPRNSRVSALTSQQSTPIQSHHDIEKRFHDINELVLNEKYEQINGIKQPVKRPIDVPVEEFVPKPQHWGGYVVIPHEMEFWVGRPSRFHERIVYKRNEQKIKDNTNIEKFLWDMEYLQP